MSTHISVPPQLLLERILTLEIVRVTERASGLSAAAVLRGPWQRERAADQGCRRRDASASSTSCPIERHRRDRRGPNAMRPPMLYIGEKVRHQCRPRKVDIAVDSARGWTTLLRQERNMPGAIANHGNGRMPVRCCTQPDV